MLVLSRNHGERILIGDDIVITVVGFGDGKVRLGIDAPRSVPVHRSEVAERIRRQKDEDRADAEAARLSIEDARVNGTVPISDVMRALDLTFEEDREAYLRLTDDNASRLRPELRKAADLSWERSEEAYRRLADDGIPCPCGEHPRAGSPCARCGRGS